MACFFSPDAQAIYTAPTSTPLTCLITLNNLKGTNPYMIKGHPIIVYLLCKWILIPWKLKILAYHILWPENYGESEDFTGISLVSILNSGKTEL